MTWLPGCFVSTDKKLNATQSSGIHKSPFLTSSAMHCWNVIVLSMFICCSEHLLKGKSMLLLSYWLPNVKSSVCLPASSTARLKLDLDGSEMLQVRFQFAALWLPLSPNEFLCQFNCQGFISRKIYSFHVVIKHRFSKDFAGSDFPFPSFGCPAMRTCPQTQQES